MAGSCTGPLPVRSLGLLHSFSGVRFTSLLYLYVDVSYCYERKTMRKLSKKQLVISLIIVLVIVGVVAFWMHKNNKDKEPAYRRPLVTKEDAKTKKTEAAQNSSQGEGGVIDKQGASSQTSAKPVTSSSGAITLQQPGSNAKLASGDSIGGLAKVDIVEFRLIDSSVGVIAQGQLKVVGGKFSGAIQFQNKSTDGRLDVFSLDPVSGAETNEVQVSIKF